MTMDSSIRFTIFLSFFKEINVQRNINIPLCLGHKIKVVRTLEDILFGKTCIHFAGRLSSNVLNIGFRTHPCFLFKQVLEVLGTFKPQFISSF